MYGKVYQVQLGLCVYKNYAVILPCDTMQLQSEAVHVKCKVCRVCTVHPLEKNHDGSNCVKAHCCNGVTGRIVWTLLGMNII